MGFPHGKASNCLLRSASCITSIIIIIIIIVKREEITAVDAGGDVSKVCYLRIALQIVYLSQDLSIVKNIQLLITHAHKILIDSHPYLLPIYQLRACENLSQATHMREIPSHANKLYLQPISLLLPFPFFFL